MRRSIEARAGGGASPTLCCALATPSLLNEIMGEMVVDLGAAGTALALFNESYVRRIAPNQRRLDKIIRLVSDEPSGGPAGVQKSNSAALHEPARGSGPRLEGVPVPRRAGRSAKG